MIGAIKDLATRIIRLLLSVHQHRGSKPDILLVPKSAQNRKPVITHANANGSRRGQEGTVGRSQVVGSFEAQADGVLSISISAARSTEPRSKRVVERASSLRAYPHHRSSDTRHGGSFSARDQQKSIASGPFWPSEQSRLLKRIQLIRSATHLSDVQNPMHLPSKRPLHDSGGLHPPTLQSVR